MTDIRLKITFDEKGKTFIETNAKPEAVEEVLIAFIRSQMGAGADTAEPDIRDVYVIDIGLDLSDDSFSVRSDTGNKSLTCGIAREVLRSLDKIEIRSFS